MNINSMISVKDAAALLGCDKKLVRDKLEQGQLKGEKRLDGGKEKWFVQKKDVEAELSKMPIVTPKGTYHHRQKPAEKARSEVPATVAPKAPAPRRKKTTAPAAENNMFFGVDVIEIVDVSEADSFCQQADTTDGATFDFNEIAAYGDICEQPVSPGPEEYFFDEYFEDDGEEVAAGSTADPSLLPAMQTMVKEFVRRIEMHRAVNARLVEELEQRDSQLRLLPDLERKADQVYKLEFEAAALRLQIACMEQEQLGVVVALERAEQEAIPQLEARLEEEFRMHAIEVARLREQLHSYAQKVQGQEHDKKCIADLENALHEMIEQKEREKRAAQAEIERVKKERANEFRRLAEQSERVRREKESELKKVAEDVARYKREKEFEVALLTDEVDLVSQERNIALAKLNDRLAEIAMQSQSIVNLEAQLKEAAAAEEQTTRAGKLESERVAKEMGEEIAALNERLTKITVQLENSRMPWWRKWLMPGV